MNPVLLLRTNVLIFCRILPLIFMTMNSPGGAFDGASARCPGFFLVGSVGVCAHPSAGTAQNSFITKLLVSSDAV